jgi:hypothetical protein
MTTVYKVEILIVNHDKLSPEEIESVIENTHYPNRCIMPKVMKTEVCEVEWTDEHPLNKYTTMIQAYEELFK